VGSRTSQGTFLFDLLNLTSFRVHKELLKYPILVLGLFTLYKLLSASLELLNKIGTINRYYLFRYFIYLSIILAVFRTTF
jgi:hypothetical protein